jgi:hypothetical protein
MAEIVLIKALRDQILEIKVAELLSSFDADVSASWLIATAASSYPESCDAFFPENWIAIVSTGADSHCRRLH